MSTMPAVAVNPAAAVARARPRTSVAETVSQTLSMAWRALKKAFRRVRRGFVAPDQMDQPLGPDRTPALRDQRRQQRPRTVPGDGPPPASAHRRAASGQPSPGQSTSAGGTARDRLRPPVRALRRAPSDLQRVMLVIWVSNS